MSYELPGWDFSSKELLDVKCHVSVNADALHQILVQVVRALHKLVRRTAELDEAIQGVAQDLVSTRDKLETKIEDVQKNVNQQIQALAQDVQEQLSLMREEAKQDRVFLHNSIRQITESVAETKRELENQVSEVRAHADQMEKRLTAGVEEIAKEMKLLSLSVNERFQTTQREIDLLKEEGDMIYGVFDLTKQGVRSSLGPGDVGRRVRLLHNTPAFQTLIEDVNQQYQSLESKLQGVQTNVDGVKREVVARVTMTEFEEFKRTVRQDDLRKQVNSNRENIERLFEGQSLHEKNMHLLDQKKADTQLLLDLQRGISQLDAKLMEQLSKEEQDKMEDLLDKIAELQHSLEKLDRRKVGRAEFNKLSKNVKAGGGVMGGYDESSVGNTSNGAGPQLSVTGDAAFLRYRCLSCNKPAAKLTDDAMKRPMQQFPPSPVLVTPTRHNQKVQNYFEWVQSTGTPPPMMSAPSPVPLEDNSTTVTESTAKYTTSTSTTTKGKALRPQSAKPK
eukprot:PhF_6_TR40912/c0_g1_i1/m.61886